MPFDPNLPQGHTLADAAQMRAQFNALKALIDALTALVNAQAAQIAELQAQLARQPGPPEVQAIVAANAARNVDGVGPLPPAWDQNPPSREEFDEARNKINELIAGLGHPA